VPFPPLFMRRCRIQHKKAGTLSRSGLGKADEARPSA